MARGRTHGRAALPPGLRAFPLLPAALGRTLQRQWARYPPHVRRAAAAAAGSEDGNGSGGEDSIAGMQGKAASFAEVGFRNCHDWRHSSLAT